MTCSSMVSLVFSTSCLVVCLCRAASSPATKDYLVEHERRHCHGLQVLGRCISRVPCRCTGGRPNPRCEPRGPTALTRCPMFPSSVKPNAGVNPRAATCRRAPIWALLATRHSADFVLLRHRVFTAFCFSAGVASVKLFDHRMCGHRRRIALDSWTPPQTRTTIAWQSLGRCNDGRVGGSAHAAKTESRLGRGRAWTRLGARYVGDARERGRTDGPEVCKGPKVWPSSPIRARICRWGRHLAQRSRI